ncbi:MAG: protein kinase [Xenococcaceae cyanobacterium MO_188.B29]|nr:protein kinase [Xenococcaceae cyanobacterium MO_188.B29]
MTNLIGQSLQNGKYTLDQELGQGGFGITYLATNSSLGQVVVIKTLSEELRQKSKVAKLNCQFQDEARRLAKCSHPNIVRVSDFFMEEGLPYIVMEYIPGLTLDQIVLPDKPLPEATAIHYIRQVGEALKIVHQQGLLHRDIKPKNLILRQETQQVVLIDFGIAREYELGSIQAHTNLVSEGYAPIEQYLPEALRTPATDVYALAATLYTLLTARIPLSAMGLYHLPPIDPRQVRSDLSTMVSQAVKCGMTLEPEHRPASVDEWLALLSESTSPSAVKIESTSSVTTKPFIPQQSVDLNTTVVKSQHFFQAQEKPKDFLGEEEDKRAINSSEKSLSSILSDPSYDRREDSLEEAQTQLMLKTSSEKPDLAPRSIVSSFLISRQRKVVVLLVTAMIALGGFPLTRRIFQFSDLTPTGEKIKEFEPVQLPLTVNEESQPQTLEATVLSPLNETSATPIPSQSVDKISSTEEKRTVQSSDTKSLSETLVTEREQATQKSQSATSTPVDKVLSVEPQRIPVPPKATSADSEAQAREAKQQREALKRQAEQRREELKRQAEQRRETRKRKAQQQRERRRHGKGKKK